LKKKGRRGRRADWKGKKKERRAVLHSLLPSGPWKKKKKNLKARSTKGRGGAVFISIFSTREVEKKKRRPKKKKMSEGRGRGGKRGERKGGIYPFYIPSRTKERGQKGGPREGRRGGRMAPSSFYAWHEGGKRQRQGGKSSAPRKRKNKHLRVFDLLLSPPPCCKERGGMAQKGEGHPLLRGKKNTKGERELD